MLRTDPLSQGPEELPQAADVQQQEETGIPLFVDLDGTLLRTDLLLESFFTMVKLQPLILLQVAFWLLRGKAYFKWQIARRIELDAGLLPYHEEFLGWLRQLAASGHELWLATASNERLAQSVADHLGIFRGVLASTPDTNLSGARKLDSIMKICGGRSFDYAGNAAIDLRIWPHARQAILVNPERGVEQAARKVASVERIFQETGPSIALYLKAMRVHQWLKNVLLFVPLFAAHAWHDVHALAVLLLAFLSFGLCASAVYLLNDLLDLPSDRAHPRKRRRPFAAGNLPLLHGVLLVPLLTLGGVTLAAMVDPRFVGVLLFYLLLTLAYSFWLKTYVLIDVLTLAGLYTLRVIAGAVAISVVPTFWLLAFSMFIFLSLALLKRCSELQTLIQNDRDSSSGRDYRVSDLDYLHSMGTASGYLSVLVLALFINDPETATRYAHPEALWLLCPILLYWVSRLWIKTGRNEMHDDPLVYAVMDRGSRITLAMGVVVALIAL